METLIQKYKNFRKDARLPVQLQRAMAKEAEAARDARAKVRFPNIFENSCPL